jgi:hypothetical protein
MYLTLAQRYRIVFLYSDNEGPKWVFKKIAKAMSCDSKTVKFWVQRYKDNEDLSDNLLEVRNAKSRNVMKLK